MHRIRIIAMIVGLVAAGCGGGGETEDSTTSRPTTQSPTTVTTAAPTTTAAAQPIGPHAVAEQVVAAIAEGDAEAWRSFMAEGSPFFDEIDWTDEDYDGDGVITRADWMQFSISLRKATRSSVRGQCAAVSDTEADCAFVFADGFHEAAGVTPGPEEARYTIHGDSVMAVENLERDDSAAANVEEARHEEMLKYELWVMDSHPDHYPSLFNEPCCDVDFVRLPAAIPLHVQLMGEYFDTAGTS